MTRLEAERLARFLILGLDTFDWNARTCGPYQRSEFLLRPSGGEVLLTSVPGEAGDFSSQAATLEPEAFCQWHDQNRTNARLGEAQTVDWLLAHQSRLDSADVDRSLKNNEHVDFETPFSYRYDWDGVLQLAVVLQSGAGLEYPCRFYLDPRWLDATVRVEWRSRQQDYRITVSGENAVDESVPPLHEQTCDLDGLGRFFEKRYNSFYARDWLAFIRAHRTPAVEDTVRKLRAEYAVPLRDEDCRLLLQRLREGGVWRYADSPRSEEQNSVRYEEGQYVRRVAGRGEVTGIGGNTLYDGPVVETSIWTE